MLFTSLALFTMAGAATVEVTPMQKVIQLLSSMLEKGKKEKHEEEVQFTKYKGWCEDTTGRKMQALKEDTERIDMDTADIGALEADVGRLGKEISGLDKNVDVWEGDIEAATKVRALEAADYEETHRDYELAVDALEQAIATLKKNEAVTEEGPSFAQVPRKALSFLNFHKLVPPAAKRAIYAFLSETESDVDTVSQATASAPESMSHGIVDMLEKLEDKFVDEKTILEKEEISAKHAFDLMVKDLKTQIDQAKGDRGEKAQAKAGDLEREADDEADLSDATALKKEDKAYLTTVSQDCGTKASEFEQRQELRSQEIEAIEKAIEILGTGVPQKAEIQLPSLVQKKTSLSQLRASGQSPTQQTASYFLQHQAKQLNSRVLSAVASRMGENPFNKVKKC